MRILLAITLCAFTVGAGAQVYRWTDAQGRVNITDTPPPASAKAKDVKRIDAATAATSPATAPQSPAQEPYELQRAKAKYPVTLYTVPNCEGCNLARSLLNARGVPFTESSLTAGKPMEEFKQLVGGNTVPAIIVGSTVQKGFEESAYQRLLDAAGYPLTGVVPPRTQGEPTAAAPGLPEVKPVAQPEQPSGPYAPAAAPASPEVKPAAQPEQASGPYVPGATAPPPPTKKKK